MKKTHGISGDTKGILRPRAIDKKFTLSRHEPSEELAYLIEHYWIVRWDLRGEKPHEAETLPYPSVHIVVENQRQEVWGVVTGRFTRRLEGAGRAFGIKFLPGAFHPFANRPVSELTNATFPLSKIFGSGGDAFVKNVLDAEKDEDLVLMAENFLCSREPVRDENVSTVNRIMEKIMFETSITKVEDIVSSLRISKRSLQRLFNEYVGVSPKWVIKRYRLQEAADSLADGKEIDLPKLALDLGYFDQAHFINDFKATVGMPPGKYARNALSDG